MYWIFFTYTSTTISSLDARTQIVLLFLFLFLPSWYCVCFNSHKKVLLHYWCIINYRRLYSCKIRPDSLLKWIPKISRLLSYTWRANMWLLLDRPFDVQGYTLQVPRLLKSLCYYNSVQLTDTFHNRNRSSEKTVFYLQLLWNRDLSSRIVLLKSCEPQIGLPHIHFLGTGIAYPRYKDSQRCGSSGFWIPVGT